MLGVKVAHDALYAPPTHRTRQIALLQLQGTLVARQPVACPAVDQDGTLRPH